MATLSPFTKPGFWFFTSIATNSNTESETARNLGMRASDSVIATQLVKLMANQIGKCMVGHLAYIPLEVVVLALTMRRIAIGWRPQMVFCVSSKYLWKALESRLDMHSIP